MDCECHNEHFLLATLGLGLTGSGIRIEQELDGTVTRPHNI